MPISSRHRKAADGGRRGGTAQALKSRSALLLALLAVLLVVAVLGAGELQPLRLLVGG